MVLAFEANSPYDLVSVLLQNKKLTSSTPVSVWRLHHQDQGKDCQRAKGKNVVEPPDSNLGVCDTESAAGIREYFLPLRSGKQERRPRQPG